MPTLLSWTIVTTALSSVVVAGPLPRANVGSVLRPRYALNFVNCDDDQKKKINTALADASVLANHAQTMDNTKKAWSHYFRTEGDGKDEDWTKAKSMWSMIAANNDPTNPPYSFSIRCAAKDDADCKGGSLAITDAAEQDGDTLREMKICAAFFDSKEERTNKNLNSKEFIKNPKRNQNSWCQPGNTFQWYEVAGLTMLHEMTHLDAVAKAAGYDSVDFGTFKSRGTEDVGGLSKTPHVAARQLAEIWQKGQAGDKTLKPFRNAESLAAAALENYIMENCDFDEIAE